jgi:hypothetical protein
VLQGRAVFPRRIVKPFGGRKSKQYPNLREPLADFCRLQALDGEKDYPPDRKVVEVMNAAGGANEEEVCNCLVYLYNERGLRPGTKNGAHSFAWFPRLSRTTSTVAKARGREYWSVDGTEREEFNRMMDAIELPDCRLTKETKR